MHAQMCRSEYLPVHSVFMTETHETSIFAVYASRIANYREVPPSLPRPYPLLPAFASWPGTSMLRRVLVQAGCDIEHVQQSRRCAYGGENFDRDQVTLPYMRRSSHRAAVPSSELDEPLPT